MASSLNDINSISFNAKSYFRSYIKDKSIEDVIKKNNEIFSEIRTLDSELQTLVYENYNKFISATNVIKNIKKNMFEIDSELVNLKTNLQNINSSYSEVDNTLKFKWKEIKKLDCMEKDLNKLKYLSELPNMFKVAMHDYESTKQGDIQVFQNPISYFENYSDVLTNYKETKFMINLYSEIKNYVLQIKTLLNRVLDSTPDEATALTVIRYLIVLNEDKSILKSRFNKIKS